MEVTKPIASEALRGDRRLTVPIYQREYAWKEDLVNGFWLDVAARAMLAFEKHSLPAHFMGALILAPVANSPLMGGTPQALVVDGQQRLTTFQLFIGSLRQIATEMGQIDFADRLTPFVMLPTYGDQKPQLRLLPTADDRDLFHHLMTLSWDEVQKKYSNLFYKNGKLMIGRAPRALRAFDLLREKIHGWITYIDLDLSPTGFDDDGGERTETGTSEAYLAADHSARLRALQNGLLEQQRFVVISLEQDDDAQVIFESLNSKREPLLAIELVRNDVFHRAARQENVEELYDTYWSRLKGEFWKKDSPRAKPKRPRVDHYLAHTLTAMSGQETSLRNLYVEYKQFVGRRGFINVEAELDALTKYASTYRGMEEGNGSDLSWLGGKLNTWEVSVATPVIFQIEFADIDIDEKKYLYKLIYSYIVRRAVCGEGSKNFNKNFERMASAFLSDGVSVATFRAVLSNTSAKNVFFPDDLTFRTAMETKPIYNIIGRKDRLQDILWELELATITKFQVNSGRPQNLTVEHILPQAWKTNWPLPDGTTGEGLKRLEESVVNGISARETALHKLGNLTLVTLPHNPSLSNRPWSDKAPSLAKSKLSLNVEISSFTAWNEETISVRGRDLAEKALSIWPSLNR
jgi:uncharacterized protein with ParB-like and HNH nuclease domain